MALRSVGAIGIHVQPDTTDFNERLKRALKKAEKDNTANIPIDLNATGIGQKLKAVRDEIQAKLDQNAAVLKIPLVGDGSKTIEKIKVTVARLNTELKKGPEIKLGMTVDGKGLNAQARTAARAAGTGNKVKLDVELDPDVGRIEREFHRLGRDAHMTLTPDITLDKKQVEDLDLKLEADVEIRRGTIEDQLKRMVELQDIVLDLDPKVNTPKARKEWERLVRDLSGHTVDLQVDIKRKGNLPVEEITLPVHVDRDALYREFETVSETTRMVLHPDIAISEMSKAALKRERLELQADADFSRARIQRTLDVMSKLKPMLLSTDPNINTAHVREQWERLKKDLDGDTVDLKADLDRQGKVKAQLALLTRNRVVDLTVRISTRSLATARATLLSLTGINVLQKGALFLEHLATNLDTAAYSAVKMGTSLATVTTSALAFTSSIIGLAGGIGQLGGYALTLPAVGVALAAVLTVSRMAFSGFKKATSGSAESMAKGLDKLPEQAQAAAISIRGLYKDIQTPVQEAFWSKMGGAFELFTSKLVPDLKSGLIVVGKSVGGFFSQFIQGFAQLGGSGVFPSLFASISSGIDEAAVGLRSLIAGFIALAAAGAKGLPDLGRSFRDMSEQFDRWVRRSIANGNVALWITNAKSAAQDLARALIGIKGQFSAIGEAAKAAGTGNLHTFSERMMDIRRTMESSIFQSTLTNLFAGAHEAMKSMRDGLGQLGYALYGLAPAMRSVMTISGATIGTVFKSLAESVKSPVFKGGLVTFFKGVSEGISGMLQALPKVADGLGDLLDLFGAVAKNILPVIGQMFGGVADIFRELKPTLKELVPILANFASNTLGIFLTSLQLLAVPMKIVLQFFNVLPKGIQTAILALILLRKFTVGGGGLFGGFKKTVTDPVVRALKTDVPGAVNASRTALARPLGTGFMSASAFRPAVTALQGIPAMVRGAATPLGGLASQAERTGGRMSSAFSGVGMAGQKAFRGLYSFIGGGWGLAFAAGFAVLSQMQENTRTIEENNKAIVQSFKDVARAAGDAGEGIGGAAAQAADLAQLDKISSQMVTQTIFGMGKNVTLGDLLDGSGLSDQAFIDVMSGKGNKAGEGYLTGLRDQLMAEKAQLADLEGAAGGPLGAIVNWIDPGGNQTRLQAAIDTTQGLLDSATNQAKQLEELWKTDVGRAQLIPAVLKNISVAAADGHVTMQNIMGIKTGIDSLAIDQTDKTAQMANSLASLVGGDQAHMAQTLDLTTDAVKRWQAAGSKGDWIGFWVQNMTRAGNSVNEIKTGLEGLGYTQEEQAKLIKFVWGPALDTAGNALTVLGEQIPLMVEGSKGVDEFSRALGAAANIDPQKLIKIFSLDGIDLAKMAQELPAAGVGLDAIREALKAAGVSGPQLSTDMGLAAEAASKLVAVTGQDIGAITDFALGLDELKDSAKGAADEAAGLFDLLDNLKGNTVLSGDITASLWDSVRTIDDWKTQATDSQTSLDDAQQSIIDAQTDGAKGIADAQDRLGKAQADSQKSVSEAQKAVREAQAEGDRAISDARKRLAKADTADEVESANQAVQDAIDAAAKNVADAQERLSSITTESVDSAGQSVQDAIDASTKGITDATEARDKALADADKSPTMYSTLRAMLSNKPGGVDFSVKGAADISKSLKELATNAIAEGIQTYNDAVHAGATPEEASRVSKASLAPMFQDLEKLKVEAGLTDTQWNTLLTTWGLTPDEIAIDVQLTTDGTLAQLAAVEKQLEEASPGIAIPITVSEDTAQQLAAAGLTVTKTSEGKYTVALDADPTKAIEQTEALKKLIAEGLPAVIPTEIAIPDASLIKPVVVPLLMDVDLDTPGVQAWDDWGKKITVTADLNPAVAGIQTLNSQGVQITVTGDINPAMAGIQILDDQGITITMGGDIDPALEGIQTLNAQGVEITVDGTLQPVEDKLATLNGREFTVNILGKLIGAGKQAGAGVADWVKGIFSADGNFIGPGMHLRSYAGGESHVAQVSNTMRLWAEPETGGEAYIPLAFAKRDRSLAILSDVATEFGYALTKASRKSLEYADGSPTVSTTNGGARVVVNQYNPVTEKDSVALLRAGQLIAAM